MSSNPLLRWLDQPDRVGACAVVIVPSGLWMRELPRRVALDEGDAFGVRALTPLDCARWIAERLLLAEGLSPLSRTAAAVLAREAAQMDLRDDPFGAEARQRPGFTTVLAGAVEALRRAGVTPAALERSVTALSARRRVHIQALSAMYVRFDTLREEQRLFDDADLLETAARALRAGGGLPERVWGVALAGPHSLHGLEQGLIEALERSVDTPIARFTEPFAVDRGADDALTSLRAGLFDGASASPKGSFDESLDLLPCPGEAGEVREALRFVMDRATRGISFPRQAILVTTASPYADLVPDVASGASAPPPLDRHVGASLLHTSPGQALDKLIGLIGGDLPASDVFELMTAGLLAFRRHPAFVTALPDEAERKIGAGRLQAVAREARVVGGGDWDDLLLRRARSWESEAEGEAQEREPTQVLRLQHKARMAKALSAVVSALRDDLDAVPSRAPLGEFGRVLAGLFERWVPWRDDRTLTAAFLRELRSLPGDRIEGRIEALRVIQAALAQRTAPGSAERGGVLVADLSAAAGLGFDSVAILGLAERQYPPPPAVDPLLPDDVRVVLGLPSVRERARQHKALFGAAVRATSGALRVTWSAVESNESRSRVPSSYALAVEEAALGGFQGEEDRQAVARLGVDPTRALSRAEHWTSRLLGARGADDRRRERAHMAEARQELRASLDLSWQRWQERLSPWDGIVAPDLARRALDECAGGIPSVTRLEKYASCPMGFLFEVLLGLRPLEDPEHEVGPDAMTLGTTVHTILERFLQPFVDAGEGFPDADEHARARLNGLIEDAFSDLQAEKNYTEPARLAMVREQAEQAVHSWLERLQKERPARPLELERSFSARDGGEPFMLSMGDEVAPVRGQIDRVDVVEEEGTRRLRIVDYKSGAPHLKKGWVEDAFDHGRHIQVACYAMAAEALLGIPVESIAYDYLDLSKGNPKLTRTAWSEERQAVVVTILDNLVKSMRAGLFAPGPNCRCWDSSALCAWAKQDRRAERTASDERWEDFRRATGTPDRPQDEEVRA
jgi:ATP-dependent helicase/nuclease subunit B